MGAKRVSVTRESPTGRNQQFRDDRSDTRMTRAEFVREIRGGAYPDYHVRNVHGVPTPVSNPDGIERNNLG